MDECPEVVQFDLLYLHFLEQYGVHFLGVFGRPIDHSNGIQLALQHLGDRLHANAFDNHFQRQQILLVLGLEVKECGVLAGAERGVSGATYVLRDAAISRLVGAVAGNVSLDYLAVYGTIFVRTCFIDELRFRSPGSHNPSQIAMVVRINNFTILRGQYLRTYPW